MCESIKKRKRTIYLSVGSNLGDRKAMLSAAVLAVGRLPETRVAAVSRIYETAPWGVTDQPNFLNLVIRGETSLDPFALLRACQQIEQDNGRVRHRRWGERTLDIDLLLYEGCTIQSEELTLPHPRMEERAFVLAPLCDVFVENGCCFIPPSKPPTEGILSVTPFEEVGPP